MSATCGLSANMMFISAAVKQADRNLMYSKSEGLPPSYTTALKQAYPGVGSGYKDERFTRARRHHIWQRNIFDPNETGSIKAG